MVPEWNYLPKENKHKRRIPTSVKPAIRFRIASLLITGLNMSLTF